MSNKNKLKLKKRRSTNMDELFPKRKQKQEDFELFRMDCTIKQAFPNPVEREKYIEDLIEGLGGDEDV